MAGLWGWYKAGVSIRNLQFQKIPWALQYMIVRTTIPERWSYNAFLVWSSPARGLCSLEYALIIKSHSGSILPWEWRMPDRRGVPWFHVPGITNRRAKK